jgi:hypothetical protein
MILHLLEADYRNGSVLNKGARIELEIGQI